MFINDSFTTQTFTNNLDDDDGCDGENINEYHCDSKIIIILMIF